MWGGCYKVANWRRLSLSRSLSHKYVYLHAPTLTGGAMDGAPALKEEGQGRGSIGGARGKRSSSWRQGLLPERGRHKTSVESYCVQVINTLLGVFWHKKGLCLHNREYRSA